MPKVSAEIAAELNGLYALCGLGGETARYNVGQAMKLGLMFRPAAQGNMPVAANVPFIPQEFNRA